MLLLPLPLDVSNAVRPGIFPVLNMCFVGVQSGKLTWQWKIQFSIGNASSKGPFFIAMLVYQRVL